ncbi:MAG: hypothetical protein ILO53_01055 [Clostridia bacterium]|nr:hypothetical protein [Clostridia bacterium]
MSKRFKRLERIQSFKHIKSCKRLESVAKACAKITAAVLLTFLISAAMLPGADSLLRGNDAAPKGSYNVARAASGIDYEIEGVDYQRFTQKPTDTIGYYDVSLGLGNMSIKGTLSGIVGLTLEEINDTVTAEMSAMNLSAEEVEVLSSLGADLTKAQWVEFGKKFAYAMTNYIPADVPGVSTIAHSVIYGFPDPSTPIEDLVASKGKKRIEAAVNIILEDMVKRPGSKLKKVPAPGLVKFAINSIFTGKDLGNSEEYNDFCKKLEAQYEKVGNFYSSCSRKLNKAMLEKNRGNGVITFDNRSFADTTAIFLGVDGVKMRYTVTGQLKRSISDDVLLEPGSNNGFYEGDLTLTAEGIDLAGCFDAGFADKTDIWAYGNHGSDWCQILYKFEFEPKARANFLSKFIFTVNSPTVIKRTMVGHFSVYIPYGDTAAVTPRLSGAFNNVSDGIDFRYRMTFGQEFTVPWSDPETGKVYGLPLQQWHLEADLKGAKAIDAIHVTWVGNEAARLRDKGESVGALVYGGDGQDLPLSSRDMGTLWLPLENAPEIRITVPG